MMKYTRKNYIDFLDKELEAQEKNYKATIQTKATLLKDRGEVFVGMFQTVNAAGFAVFKIRNSDNIPSKKSFWTAVFLTGEMARFKNWGNLSWNNLRAQYQRGFSDCLCAWVSKSDDPSLCLVGIKNLTVDFLELLKPGKTIIAFGPKDPPVQYLMNLKAIVKDENNPEAGHILNFSENNHQWSPQKVGAHTDLVSKLLNSLTGEKCVVVQGPPGTGKTTRMAQLASKLLKENNSVLVTALTNQALIELAKKSDLREFIEKGKVSKTSLTGDELRELPTLQRVKENKCNATNGNLTLATFYVASGWGLNNSDIPFDYVIMDEASQALLPMIAAAMKLGRKVILIGDQKQLPPIVLTNEDLILRYGWADIIKGFQTICNYFDYSSYMLSDTYRLTQRGAECTGVFYNNSLHSVSSHKKVITGITDLNTKGGPVIKELDMEVGKKAPQNAVEYIYALTRNLLIEDPKAEIAVLSKFKETKRTLQNYFNRNWNGNSYPDNVKIETIDSVQGLTVHYCIFLIPDASIRYSLDPELFNVATSRAMYNTILVLPSTLYRDRIPKEVKDYLIMASQR